ncbi:acyl-CoA reductase [Fructobacillus americanaquae]|uniref:Acyl-CoA reductase n=1 Tax=Fructobacillus americanaquae TaxID=2940302 RepID=A0ABY5BZ20_9LACO|nr:acyl-CoA reductase [Fructobacillus americanaquae]USS91761.1 acyl-CoA reductase [Fructobacillus americanaquae]
MAKEGETTKINLFLSPNESQFNRLKTWSISVGKQRYDLQYPDLTEQEVKETIKTLKDHQQAFLSQLSVEEIILMISTAAEKWMDPEYNERQLALKLLPIITGYSEETINLEIRRYMRLFRAKELRRFLNTELANPAILDAFQPQASGSLTKAYGPQTSFHVFSGNIPGLQVWSLVMTLLVKSARFGKTSFAEPLFPVLFGQSLLAVEPRLAGCLAIFPWKGGSKKSVEKAAAAGTEATIAYGSDQSVKNVQTLVPAGHLFLHFGYKISFALVGQEALATDRYQGTVNRAGADVAIYDQQSCLSPQCIFVERGGSLSPKDFASALAADLASRQQRWPRADLDDQQATAINRLRAQFQLEAIADHSLTVYSSPQKTDWTVVYHDQPIFISSPLNRFVHVVAVDNLLTVPIYLRPYQQYLQTAGIAVAPKRLLPITDTLGQAGLCRITALGEMTRARPGWHHDGRFNILDLLRFTDIEPSAESLAEHLDTDVEW